MEWLSKSTKRVLLEMSVGVILYNLVLAGLAVWLLPKVSYPVVPVLLGLAVGAAGAMCMLVHMAVMTERALDSQNESYANKLTVAQSLLRKVIFIAALFFFWRVLKMDLLAAVVGAMGMKAGAYMQPLVRRLSGYHEEPSPEALQRAAELQAEEEADKAAKAAENAQFQGES